MDRAQLSLPLAVPARAAAVAPDFVRQDDVVPSVPSVVPDTTGLRKARGAFFTPAVVARHITNWAVRSTGDTILEPSCGEAAFLLAAVDRLATLRGAGGNTEQPRLDGVELHDESAQSARSLLSAAGVDARIAVADFFAMEPTGCYDVVIGNPPFVRYQDFAGESRALSRAAALRAGVGLTNLASSWAAFTVHAALFLRRGGRMGLVLPAELLSVNYAADVRRFLFDSFRSVELVLFDERVFPDVQEEVVLLLADGYLDGPTDHTGVRRTRNAAELMMHAPARVWRPVRPEEKWTPSLLPLGALTVYSDLVDDGGTAVLEQWGDTTLGMVTGNNKFFALSPARADELGLAPSDLIPLSPPGSRHLRGLALVQDDLTRLGEAGAATWLFRPSGEPSSAADRYIRSGEAAGVDDAYKCRVRTPWWRVPLVPPADLLLTYMNADTPRLSNNAARAGHLNSVHGVYVAERYRELGRELLPLASLTSLTLVGAETVGRSYGGGMLKLEPREADRLPVASPALVDAARDSLRALRPRVEQLLTAGALLDAVALIDDVLLVGQLGRRPGEVAELRAAFVELRGRRAARGGVSRAR